MPYSLRIKRSAAKALSALPKADRVRLAAAIDKLCVQPASGRKVPGGLRMAATSAGDPCGEDWPPTRRVSLKAAKELNPGTAVETEGTELSMRQVWRNCSDLAGHTRASCGRQGQQNKGGWACHAHKPAAAQPLKRCRADQS